MSSLFRKYWSRTIQNYLFFSPKQDIYLNKVPGENDPVDIVILKNTSDSNILFKIKTTSPEKFRVRPSMGTVKPGGIEAVRLYLQNGRVFISQGKRS